MEERLPKENIYLVLPFSRVILVCKIYMLEFHGSMGQVPSCVITFACEIILFESLYRWASFLVVAPIQEWMNIYLYCSWVLQSQVLAVPKYINSSADWPEFPRLTFVNKKPEWITSGEKLEQSRIQCLTTIDGIPIKTVESKSTSKNWSILFGEIRVNNSRAISVAWITSTVEAT